jgi:hypothetical protein
MGELTARALSSSATVLIIMDSSITTRQKLYKDWASMNHSIWNILENSRIILFMERVNKLGINISFKDTMKMGEGLKEPWNGRQKMAITYTQGILMTKISSMEMVVIKII